MLPTREVPAFDTSILKHRAERGLLDRTIAFVREDHSEPGMR